jgi:hypothetical protein
MKTSKITNPELNVFAAALEPFKASIKADFIKWATREATRLIETYGAAISRLSGKWGQDGQLYRYLRSFIKSDFYQTELPTLRGEAIESGAQRYADEQIDSFTYKLTRKLENRVREIVIADIDTSHFTFTVYGKTAARADVRIDQQRVFKVSSKGTPFHQWPARIYVEGSFVPEATFVKNVLPF